MLKTKRGGQSGSGGSRGGIGKGEGSLGGEEPAKSKLKVAPAAPVASTAAAPVALTAAAGPSQAAAGGRSIAKFGAQDEITPESFKLFKETVDEYTDAFVSGKKATKAAEKKYLYIRQMGNPEVIFEWPRGLFCSRRRVGMVLTKLFTYVQIGFYSVPWCSYMLSNAQTCAACPHAHPQWIAVMPPPATLRRCSFKAWCMACAAETVMTGLL